MKFIDADKIIKNTQCIYETNLLISGYLPHTTDFKDYWGEPERVPHWQ